MTHGDDGSPGDDWSSGGDRSAGPRGWSRRTWLLVAVPVAVVLALVVTLLSPWGLVGRGPAGVLPLPGEVAGLDRREGAASEQTDDLAERLRADPAVAGVAVGAFDSGTLSVVVLRLSPRRPFDDETAGRLTAQVLGASRATPGGGDVRSVTSEDGEALLTCTSPSPTSSTCVAVQAREALLVLTSGELDDPLSLTARVRDDVRAG